MPDPSDPPPVALAEPPPQGDAPPASIPPGWEGLLHPGERILWQGRPSARILWADLLQMQTAMGLFFVVFSIVWINMARDMGGRMRDFGPGDLFPLFGLPFLAMGLYMAGGRLLWDALLRRVTRYTLTDRAALIATDLLGQRRLDRHDLTADTPLRLEDGTPGTIWFARKVTEYRSSRRSFRHYSGTRTVTTQIGFRQIPRVREVYGLMQGAIAAARAPAPPSR